MPVLTHFAIRMELAYLQSEFRGLLPKAFEATAGTRVIPSHMNNLNKEEPSRYVRDREEGWGGVS